MTVSISLLYLIMVSDIILYNIKMVQKPFYLGMTTSDPSKLFFIQSVS